uniref:Uncharacterized protein n=1 Tax=Ciona savignyi TaxID=51511 RepID=H2YW61_CIOSA
MDVTTIPVTVNGTQNGTPGPHAEEMNNLCEEEQNKKDAEYQLDLLSDFIDNGEDGDEEED